MLIGCNPSKRQQNALLQTDSQVVRRSRGGSLSRRISIRLTEPGGAGDHPAARYLAAGSLHSRLSLQLEDHGEVPRSCCHSYCRPVGEHSQVRTAAQRSLTKHLPKFLEHYPTKRGRRRIQMLAKQKARAFSGLPIGLTRLETL